MYRHWKEPIIPIVFYHGQDKNWRGPSNFQDSLESMHPTVRENFGQHILNFSYRLVNIHQIMKNRDKEQLASWPILFVLKNIWDVDESIIKGMFVAAQNLGPKDRLDCLERTCKYLQKYHPYLSLNVLSEIEAKVVTDNKDQTIMPQVRSMIEDERQVGVDEGINQVALKMLANGVEIKSVSKYTGLSQLEVARLKKSLQ